MLHFLKIPIKMLMEDHDGVTPNLTHLTGKFFSVYDDHGGSQVPEYCRHRIRFALAEEIERNKGELCNSKPTQARQIKWKRVFTNSFQSVTNEVAGKISRPGAGSSDKALEDISPDSTGSTALVALVW